MTTTLFIVTFIICAIKLLMTCLPTGVVNWIFKKFQTHPIIKEDQVVVTVGDKTLNQEEKKKVVENFNNAIFMERRYIYPGNESSFLQPGTNVEPIIIDLTDKKKKLKMFLFNYDDRVDVVKQNKKKTEAYSLYPVPFNEILK